MSKFLFFLLAAICLSCTHSPKTEKYQNRRDNIINVQKQMKEIKLENVLIGQTARLYLIDDYLIIGDYKPQDKLIHIFNKETFCYVTSIAYPGQGPGEIAMMGHIGINEANRMFYVSDHGKQRIFSYDLDSVIANPLYIPKEKIKMNATMFPDKYQYINDTLSIGLIIEPIGSADYKPSVAKWNMNTGEIKRMKYEHPDIEKKRISFAISMNNEIYVECYSYHDLMTICNLEGDLKYNIYGPDWNSQKTKVRYYENVAFCNDKILALYSGEASSFANKSNSRKVDFPTSFLVFDIDGNYIQTLETEYQITSFCYDKENNRVLMNLDDEIQFACLELGGLTI